MSTASEVARSGPRAQPRICCLDLDTFFVSVERVREIARRVSPVVLVASIDEMFLDFAGCERLYGRPGDEGGDAAIVSGMGHDLPPAFWPVVFDAVCPPDSASRR